MLRLLMVLNDNTVSSRQVQASVVRLGDDFHSFRIASGPGHCDSAIGILGNDRLGALFSLFPLIKDVLVGRLGCAASLGKTAGHGLSRSGLGGV